MVSELAIFAVGLSVCFAMFGAGWALSKVGVACVATLAEKPEQFFKGFLVVTLCEALAIYGLVIGLLLLIGF